MKSQSDHALLLSVRNLSVRFPIRRGIFRRTVGYTKAVDDVSFHITVGETLGLVGESGCGKSTIARAVLRLIPAQNGSVTFSGRSVLNAPSKTMRKLRREMQIIFQDPGGSLNPRMRVGSIVGEPLLVHGVAKGKALRLQVDELLQRCGLSADASNRYPHEFSGGQRQRVAIARALTLKPKLIICDEPTSSLDVSVQAQILNLLKDLQDEFGLSYLFISHDMAVIHHMCDRIAVMKNGKIVEHGDSEQVIQSPQHQYTQTLLAAVPDAAVAKCRSHLQEHVTQSG